MELTFVQLAAFVARWRQHGLTDDDLRHLERMLLADPVIGSVVAGAGGLRKVRFAPPSRHVGKRGAFRVGYAYIPVASAAYLFVLYPKNEQATLTAAEKVALRRVIAAIQSRR